MCRRTRRPDDPAFGFCARIEPVVEKPKRSDPLWLRILLSLVLSCVLSVLVLMAIGDLLGPSSLFICGALALVSTVLMAWKGRRVGKIATWFFELLAGI